jgi:hypothetical protein
VETDPIWAARGKAIQGYAQLESAFSFLLAQIGGMSTEVAATIFYKITSTGARNAIIEKLLHKKFGNTYNVFWNSFLTAMRSVDTKRNEIVHWLSAVHMGMDANNVIYAGVTLLPPAQLPAIASAGPMITTADLKEFQEKCQDCGRLITMFSNATTPPDGSDPQLTQPWLEVFQQPFVYPLPVVHPLNQPMPTISSPA